MHCTRRPASQPNVVPIPEPDKLLDPLYWQAHTLVDQVPRRALPQLVDMLLGWAKDGRPETTLATDGKEESRRPSRAADDRSEVC